MKTLAADLRFIGLAWLRWMPLWCGNGSKVSSFSQKGRAAINCTKRTGCEDAFPRPESLVLFSRLMAINAASSRHNTFAGGRSLS
jgi:hypothetical protein